MRKFRGVRLLLAAALAVPALAVPLAAGGSDTTDDVQVSAFYKAPLPKVDYIRPRGWNG